jgi:CRISPR-associated protein Csx17
MLGLLQGMMLIDGVSVNAVEKPPGSPQRDRFPDALYAVLKLCFAGEKVRGEPIPMVPSIHVRAMAGDGARASALAIRRLRASGVAPQITTIGRAGERVRRTAAALLFPLSRGTIERLAKRVCGKEDDNAAPVGAEEKGENDVRRTEG